MKKLYFNKLNISSSGSNSINHKLYKMPRIPHRCRIILEPNNKFNNKQNCCPAYCNCEFPNYQTLLTQTHVNIPDLVKCRCGEEDEYVKRWMWHHDSDTDATITGCDVTFHPVYSQGVAMVRGNTPLKAGMIHYWEIRILTVLVGTDVMFGIGTDKVNLNEFKYSFESALGINNQSWGFSYNGKIQHKGIKRPYGQKFSQGCILGVLLDRSRGYLEFFLNRRSLGIAYTNIPTDPNVVLYPMMCSTAAKSAVRLMNAASQPDSLQLRAFQALKHQPKALEELRQMPGLKSIMQENWFLAPPIRYSQQSLEDDLDIADEAVLPKLRLNRKQKFKVEDGDLSDIYANAHKIAWHSSFDENEELQDEGHHCLEYFDEYFHNL